ncbi:MAG: hypothetical protein GYB66_15810, partial [Chloroflexi bacterium]|nr:hypothetical protein [Chloroflexota bacterium]
TATAGVQVTVGAPPNQDPQIDPIPPQTCQAGDTPTVTVTASDPDGDPVTLAATSTAPGVADATVAGTTLTINCVAEGMATINLTATDGQGGTAAADVQVTVSAAPPPNQEPSIDSIPPQTCQAGEAPTVMVTATDPDDDPVMLQASSTAPGVATVTVAGTTLTINCVAEGTATISVLADDGQGGIASINFAVDVTAAPLPNQSPVIDPIAPLELTVGQTVPVAISYSDPEDDPVTVTPTSDNPGIATVTQESEFQLSVTAVADGTATITVVVDDGQGGTNSTSFPVTVVGQAPPPFDITAYPDLPDLNALKQQLNPVYTDGINNQGKLPTAFSIAGDDSLSNANFLDPIAVGNYNLGNFSNLQTAIDHYNFAIQSVAVGSGWNVQTLLDPAAADPGLCDPGATPLDCELRRSSPVVIFISFAPSNATAVDVATFKSTLETIVDQSLGAGTIPVLATLPDDGTVDPATLAQYNQAIVEVATEHSAHPDLDVPLWNVYMTMQGAPQGVYAVAPAGAADFTDPSLTYGVNRRNWQALQILEAFRTTFP